MATSKLTVEEATDLAKAFLEAYTIEDAFWEEGDDGERRPVVSLQHVTTGKDGVRNVLFMVDEEGTETDPKVTKLVDAAMAALKKKHPEVFAFAIELDTWST